MIDPFQLATQGIGPGWSTFSFATQGFGFEIEIEIKPIPGGGWSIPLEKYEIIVRVRYKGKLWQEKREISGLTAKSLEKVFATFKALKIHTITIIASLNNISEKVVKNIKAFFKH